MSDWITPKDLSRELDVDEKAIRDYLRANMIGHLRYQRWRLEEDQAAAVRAYFRSLR
jgi:hypothetical protein